MPRLAWPRNNRRKKCWKRAIKLNNFFSSYRRTRQQTEANAFSKHRCYCWSKLNAASTDIRNAGRRKTCLGRHLGGWWIAVKSVTHSFLQKIITNGSSRLPWNVANEQQIVVPTWYFLPLKVIDKRPFNKLSFNTNFQIGTGTQTLLLEFIVVTDVS